MNTRHIFNAALLATFLSLSACGGGDDVTPDTFTLEDVKDAEPGQFYTASMKVAGVNAPVKARVCCTGSTPVEFSIDGGTTWQTDVADVENGDEVMIRLKSKSEESGIVNATLFIGGTTGSPDSEGTVKDNFQVVTKSDIEKPELAIHFPPPISMTDAPIGGAAPASITVRGRAVDDFDLSKVMINDAEAALDDATGEWIFNYKILAGDNLIQVVATDAAGRETTKSLTLKHVNDSTGLDFGTGKDFTNPKTAFWDSVRSMVIVTDTYFAGVSLTTADRVRLPASGRPFGSCGLHDVGGDRYIACGAGDSVVSLDPDSDVVEMITVKGDGKGSDVDFNVVHDVALDTRSNRIFAKARNDANTDAHLWVIDGDATSAAYGTRERFSDEAFNADDGLAVDSARNQLLIGSHCDLKVLPLDATPGTNSSVLIPAAADFCANGITVLGGKAWTKTSVTGENQLIEIDLEDATYRTIDLNDPLHGPVVENVIYFGEVAVDSAGIVYTTVESVTPANDGLIAIDPVTGYRVIVAQN